MYVLINRLCYRQGLWSTVGSQQSFGGVKSYTDNRLCGWSVPQTLHCSRVNCKQSIKAIRDQLVTSGFDSNARLLTSRALSISLRQKKISSPSLVFFFFFLRRMVHLEYKISSSYKGLHPVYQVKIKNLELTLFCSFK